MTQSYSAKNFARSFKKSDIQRFGLNGVEVPNFLNEQIKKCIDQNHTINGLKNSKDKKIYYLDTAHPHEHLMVRHCSRVLKDLNNINVPDRKKLINLIKNILEDCTNSGNLNIHRFDIKNFFESIEKENIKDVINDTRLNSNINSTLNSIYKNKNKMIRGISITSIIAEKYMEQFDKNIKVNSKVLYYFRYVDDIFIIAKDNSDEHEIKLLVEENLPKGLRLNEGKHNFVIIRSSKLIKYKVKKQNHAGVFFYNKNNSDVFIEFLGYKFLFDVESKIKVNLGISESKKSNIKRKIIRSFYKYKIEKDFEMLFLRINYICSNIRIVSNRKLYSGIYYNYNLIDFDWQRKSGLGYQDLMDIHLFLQSLIFNSNKHPSVRGVNLSKIQVQRLRRINILSGFKDKRVLKLTNEQISKIKGAWFNVK